MCDWLVDTPVGGAWSPKGLYCSCIVRLQPVVKFYTRLLQPNRPLLQIETKIA